MSSAPAKDSKATVFFKRTASTLGLWGVVALGFASRQDWAYLILIGAIMVLATVEYFQMLRVRGEKCFPRFGIGLAVLYAVAMSWFLLRGDGVLPVGFTGAAVFLAIAGAFALQLRHPIRGDEPLKAVAFTLLGFIYLPVLFGYAPRLVFELDGPGEVPGAMVLLWLIAVTKFTDMGAYIVGSAIGKHKMIPHVSPGKTWQGFGGALIFSQLAGCGLYAFFQDDMPNFATGLHVLGGWGAVVGLGVVIALLAVIGDLAESVVKRSLEAKDSGHMLPGIGGALDLIDSLCFTAPFLYFYLQWVH
ncbi:phosphatidate cytidylyltransferase [Haloferula rosea]|uniref:phosphatidate cytidylyltransferase n=1 Tax=Haloferula rosea TaxID=490093 RepID=UPI001906EDAA|nr:phosphatidate cytidylyltransferase [Haloferula rosea]